MQAAFVDIGLERNGFLYVNDAVLDLESRRAEDEDKAESRRCSGSGHRRCSESQVKKFSSRSKRNLWEPREQGLHGMSPYLDALWSKCLSVSILAFRNELKLAERTRLTDLITENDDATSGYIARTASDGAAEADLMRDIEILEKLWKSIESQGAQGLVHASSTLIFHSLYESYVTSSPMILNRWRLMT